MPSDEVLDLSPSRWPSSRCLGGRSVQVGDLVLSPGLDPDVLAWLNPVLARWAVRLDERPGRSSRGLRIAMPVPARDGSWAVEGWSRGGRGVGR